MLNEIKYILLFVCCGRGCLHCTFYGHERNSTQRLSRSLIVRGSPLGEDLRDFTLYNLEYDQKADRNLERLETNTEAALH